MDEDGERGKGDRHSEEAGLQRLLHVGTPGAIAGAYARGAALSRLSRVAGMARARSVVRGRWPGHGTFVLRVVRDPLLRSRFGAWLHRFPSAGDQRETTRKTPGDPGDQAAAQAAGVPELDYARDGELDLVNGRRATGRRTPWQPRGGHSHKGPAPGLPDLGHGGRLLP